MFSLLTVYEATFKVDRGSEQQTAAGLELNGSQITAYVLIINAHLLSALPENPAEVISALIAPWRRRLADDVTNGPAAATATTAAAAAAESGAAPTHLALQQPAARRHGATTPAVEHNNK